MPLDVRPATPADDVAPLLYESASGVYRLMFGSQPAALSALRRLARNPGTSASYDACLVAVLEGRIAGVLAGYPLSEGPARARSFFARGFLRTSPARWPAVVRLVRAGGELTPAAPAGAYYVDAIATAAWARRQGVASALLRAAEAVGRASGATALALDTGLSNASARALYEDFGMSAGDQTRVGSRGRTLGLPEEGFVGYVKAL